MAKKHQQTTQVDPIKRLLDFSTTNQQKKVTGHTSLLLALYKEQGIFFIVKRLLHQSWVNARKKILEKRGYNLNLERKAINQYNISNQYNYVGMGLTARDFIHLRLSQLAKEGTKKQLILHLKTEPGNLLSDPNKKAPMRPGPACSAALVYTQELTILAQLSFSKHLIWAPNKQGDPPNLKTVYEKIKQLPQTIRNSEDTAKILVFVIALKLRKKTTKDKISDTQFYLKLIDALNPATNQDLLHPIDCAFFTEFTQQSKRSLKDCLNCAYKQIVIENDALFALFQTNDDLKGWLDDHQSACRAPYQINEVGQAKYTPLDYLLLTIKILFFPISLLYAFGCWIAKIMGENDAKYMTNIDAHKLSTEIRAEQLNITQSAILAIQETKNVSFKRDLRLVAEALTEQQDHIQPQRPNVVTS